MRMRLELVTYQSVSETENGGWIFQHDQWWCGHYACRPPGNEPPMLKMKWAGKHQFPGFEVALCHEGHFIPLTSLLESGVETVLPDMMAGLDRSRYMNALYNEWGTLTWLLIHSNESCSQRTCTKKKCLSSPKICELVFFSVRARLREIMSWYSFWWNLNMLDLMVEIAPNHCIILWCSEHFHNIWIGAS